MLGLGPWALGLGAWGLGLGPSYPAPGTRYPTGSSMSDNLKQYRAFRDRMNARIMQVGPRETLHIGPVVGRSIVNPHLRRAMATLDDIAAERLPEARS